MDQKKPSLINKLFHRRSSLSPTLPALPAKVANPGQQLTLIPATSRSQICLLDAPNPHSPISVSANIAPWMSAEPDRNPDLSELFERTTLNRPRMQASTSTPRMNEPIVAKREVDEEVAPWGDSTPSISSSLGEFVTEYASNDRRLSRLENSAKMANPLTPAPHEKGDFTRSYKKDRIYLACLIFNEKKEVLLYKKGLIPSICLYGDDDESGELFENFLSSDHFTWAKQVSLDFEPTVHDCESPANPFSFTAESMADRLADIDEPLLASTRFRKKFYRSASTFQQVLELRNMGIMEKSPIEVKFSGCILMLNLVSVKSDMIGLDVLSKSNCSWCPAKKMNQNVYSGNYAWAAYEDAYQRSTRVLREGLYLAFFNCVVTLKGAMVLVQKDYATLPPIKRIRDKASLDELETNILSATTQTSFPDKSKLTQQLIEAIGTFSPATTAPISLRNLISITPTQLDNNVHILILAHTYTLGDKLPEYDSNLYELISLQLFELLHVSRYSTKLHTDYFRKMRTLKAARQDKVSMTSMASVVTNEMKDSTKRFNDAKWTRQALEFKVSDKTAREIRREEVESAAAQHKLDVCPFD